MTPDTERVLSAMKDAVAELEALAKDTAEMAGERAEAAKESLRDRLEQATEKVRGLEQELRRRMQSGARTADHYVKKNPWRSLGIVAVAAFLLGALVSHRE